jgi:pimeloyl-ACP methyl ester carboxylesterase
MNKLGLTSIINSFFVKYKPMNSTIKIIPGTILLGLLTFCSSSTGPGTVQSKDNVEIHYTVYGTSGPLLVLIHCWCCDQTYWENQVELLAEKYRVVTVDLAGHGLSGTDRQKWTLESFGNDVVSVVDKLKAEKVILVGHSMGGYVALYAAVKLKNKPEGIILVDALHDIWWPVPDSTVSKSMEPFRDNFRQATYNYVYRWLFPGSADSVIRDKIATDMSSDPPEIGIATMANLRNSDFSSLLKEVKALNVPVLLMNIDLFPTDYAAMDSLGFQVVALNDVGHFPMLEKPDDFNTEFLKILSGIE